MKEDVFQEAIDFIKNTPTTPPTLGRLLRESPCNFSLHKVGPDSYSSSYQGRDGRRHTFGPFRSPEEAVERVLAHHSISLFTK